MLEVAAGAWWRARLLAELGEAELTVTGSCMEPLLPEGRRVRVTAAARRRCRFGDVVLVETGAGPRLHRLVLALPGLPVLTKADRGATWDRPLPRCRILGRAALPRDRRAALQGLGRVVAQRLLRALRARAE